MAKKKAAKIAARQPARKKAAKKLSTRGQQVVSYLLNTIAFQTHSKDGDVESIAAHLGIEASRLRPTLKKMEEHGSITVEGSGEFVYPTVRALRKQQQDLSVADARSCCGSCGGGKDRRSGSLLFKLSQWNLIVPPSTVYDLVGAAYTSVLLRVVRGKFVKYTSLLLLKPIPEHLSPVRSRYR